MLLLISSFIAGFLTVLAPCVLPLLPIIIGGSVSGNLQDKRRPVIITMSLALSVMFFTLLLKISTALINIPPTSIAFVSGFIVIIIGLLMLFPQIYARIILKLNIENNSQKILGKSFQNKQEYIGPIVTGAALGPVFSSCSPVYAYILATVLPVSFGQALIYITAYILGLALALLGIGYFGQSFIRKIKFASNPKGIFQRSIAVIFIIVGLLIVTGTDKSFQAYIADKTAFDYDNLSSKLLPKSNIDVDDKKLLNVQPYDAPEFVGLENWINSDPQDMKSLKGKVVLVDFWTYSCINCIRNNPRIEALYERYKDDGFTVIGIHAPEFAFEKQPENVRKAVKDQGISYPVALDNNFETWNAYNNRSWPASYLVDAKGKVHRIHEGEGQYKEQEEAVRQLLQENGVKLNKDIQESSLGAPVSANQTPETYLGTKRASNYAGIPALGASGQPRFSAKENLQNNEWALEGLWDVGQENIIAVSDSKLRFNVSAKDVYLVASSQTKGNIKVLVDGKPIESTDYTTPDSSNGLVPISESKLYRIADFKKFRDNVVLEIQVQNGVSLNAFTFGS